jgi:hypothetical protein
MRLLYSTASGLRPVDRRMSAACKAAAMSLAWIQTVTTMLYVCKFVNSRGRISKNLKACLTDMALLRLAAFPKKCFCIILQPRQQFWHSIPHRSANQSTAHSFLSIRGAFFVGS